MYINLLSPQILFCVFMLSLLLFEFSLQGVQLTRPFKKRGIGDMQLQRVNAHNMKDLTPLFS
jgi:hypothetical protein